MERVTIKSKIDEIVVDLANKRNQSKSSVEVDWRIKETLKELEKELMKLDKAIFEAKEEAESQQQEIRNKYNPEITTAVKKEAEKLLKSIQSFKESQSNIINNINSKIGFIGNFDTINILKFEKHIEDYLK